jgi:hypothetical protein
MSPSPWHNRQDPADFLKGARYILADDEGIAIGWPVKASGSGSKGAVGGPPHDVYVSCGAYDDEDGLERCLGVSDDQILPRGAPGSDARKVADALFKSQNEWRHGRRDLSIVVHGVRDMVNRRSGSVMYDNDPVAPAPGGFQPFEAGMSYLGRVKKGPVGYLQRAPIIIEPTHFFNGGDGWDDDGGENPFEEENQT